MGSRLQQELLLLLLLLLLHALEQLQALELVLMGQQLQLRQWLPAHASRQLPFERSCWSSSPPHPPPHPPHCHSL